MSTLLRLLGGATMLVLAASFSSASIAAEIKWEFGSIAVPGGTVINPDPNGTVRTLPQDTVFTNNIGPQAFKVTAHGYFLLNGQWIDQANNPACTDNNCVFALTQVSAPGSPGNIAHTGIAVCEPTVIATPGWCTGEGASLQTVEMLRLDLNDPSASHTGTANHPNWRLASMSLASQENVLQDGFEVFASTFADPNLAWLNKLGQRTGHECDGIGSNSCTVAFAPDDPAQSAEYLYILGAKFNPDGSITPTNIANNPQFSFNPDSGVSALTGELIPEPATLVLLAPIAAMFAVRRRKLVSRLG